LCTICISSVHSWWNADHHAFVVSSCFPYSGETLPAAWNYGAVERAFRDAAGKGGGRIFEPVVGKKFESIQEAFEFYNLYSWEIGFGIRLGRSRENKSGRRTMQDIVCACEVNMSYIFFSMA
jgi:hypothetical protein